MKIGSSFIFHRDVIGPADAPYMVRYKLIDTPWFAIRVHRILRSDSDRHLHDHPWHFLSFVLSGGYREETPDGEREIQAPAIVAHRATDLHRLTLDRPATTLVFCGPRFREWGFRTEHFWVPWQVYLARPYEQVGFISFTNNEEAQRQWEGLLESDRELLERWVKNNGGEN